MNVVLIVVDTLRYDHVGANGNPAVHTPNLDRLAAGSWRFTRAFSASYPTIPQRTDVITGRYGAPFHRWQPLDCDKPTLPRVLAERGYATQLIHDTPHLVNGGHRFDYPFHAWTPVRGAEVDRAWITDAWEYLPNWRLDPMFDPLPRDDATVLRTGWTTGAGYVHTNHGRTAEADWNVARLFTTAARFLRDNARRTNLFLWIDCFDPHEPWDSPPDYVRRYDRTPGYDGRLDPRSFGAGRNRPGLAPRVLAHLKAQYAAKVTLMDRWLGHFLDTLEETGLATRTAVILTADHGTNLDDRDDSRQGQGTREGRGAAAPRFGKTVPPLANEAHVPLLLRVPDQGAGVCAAITQPQDLFATVSTLAGGAAGGAAMPERAGQASVSDMESFDLLATAQAGGSGRRAVALCGRAVDGWRQRPDGVLFAALDGEWCLGVAARTAACQLRRLGSATDVAGRYPEVVARLRGAAVEEIGRRGLDPALLDWLRREGDAPMPEDFRVTDAHPAPPGWRTYFQNLYHGE